MATNCDFCGKQFANKYLVNKHNKYHKGGGCAAMTQKEHESLRPSELGSDHVRCQLCGPDVKTKDFSKLYIMRHLRSQHKDSVSAASLKDFVIKREEYALKMKHPLPEGVYSFEAIWMEFHGRNGQVP